MRGGKGAPAVQRPPRPPPPVRVRRSPARRRRGGRDWARSEVGRDLEKPPRLHCSGRGRPEEPVPQSRHPAGRSRSEVPRCLDLPGPGGSAWRGREALLRGGPRPADQALATTARRVNARRPTVAEKVVTAAREVLRRQSSVASGTWINHLCSAFGSTENFIFRSFIRDPAALSLSCFLARAEFITEKAKF
ncbi:uncharacterized protein LOC125098548 isoform X3 [Lutra lutra]|uniref:uncharacterized protein LOC125098548 isoform X3 n=1 Tax=Lutra lutra TaxID=9657 RepID=UPI001FD39786|nr:uncharacterized protein LOC125098548 isoform X3 [Lutra lutra]